jgi:hypothetical protein
MLTRLLGGASGSLGGALGNHGEGSMDGTQFS